MACCEGVVAQPECMATVRGPANGMAMVKARSEPVGPGRNGSLLLGTDSRQRWLPVPILAPSRSSPPLASMSLALPVAAAAAVAQAPWMGRCCSKTAPIARWLPPATCSRPRTAPAASLVSSWGLGGQVARRRVGWQGEAKGGAGWQGGGCDQAGKGRGAGWHRG